MTLDAAVAGAAWKPSPVRAPAAPRPLTLTATTFPAAAHIEVALPAGGPNLSHVAAAKLLTPAAGTPLLVGPAAADLATRSALAATGSSGAAAAPGKVSVTVADHAAATAAGVTGVVASLARVDGQSGAATVNVGIDYSTFAQAFGGDLPDRLKLVALPACALTTPKLPACRTQTPVTFDNDQVGKKLTATVTLPGTATSGTATSGTATSGTATSGTATSASKPSTAQKAPVMVLAAQATSTGTSGSYGATSLSASNGWGEAGNTGSFTYSYPVTIPPALGGAAPSVALSYDSGAVDGKTAVENSQPSWIGDGWDYSTGYIERTYVPCAKTLYPFGGYPTSNDNCFARDAQGNLLPALTLSFGSHGGQLVPIDATNTSFVLPTDDGTQVDVLYGQLNNGTRTGEFYRVRTPDGSVAFFGADILPDPSAFTAAPGSTIPMSSGVTTGSTWLEPVFGDSAASGCQDPTKVTTPGNCLQAWRWNVDFAFDPHNNATRYSYLAETNYYGFGTAKVPTWYVRGGVLKEIDYGWQLADLQGTSAKPADEVVFTTKTRCVDPAIDDVYATGYGVGQSGCGAGAFDAVPTSNLVDTPVDQNCPSTGVSNNQCQTTSPTFWSSRRLAGIDTYVAVGGTPKAVDHWDLFDQFHTLDTANSPMWLAAIRHCASSAVNGATGVCPQARNGVAGQLTLPDVRFSAVAMPQRVPGVTGTNVPPNLPSYLRERIGVIFDELGASTTVAYDDPTLNSTTGKSNYAPLGCTAPPTVAPDWHNTQLCYPEYWSAPGTAGPFTDWFHKYVVTSITTQDNSHAAGTPTPIVTTAYTYGSTTSTVYSAAGSNGAGVAWHSNDSELVLDSKYRSYDQYRGFAVVTATTGAATDGPGHPTAQTVTTYLRGMDQDPDQRAASAATCALSTASPPITPAADCTGWNFTDDLSGVATRDDNALAGTVFETQTIDTATGRPFSTTVGVPWISPAVAEHTRISPLPALRSRQLGTAQGLTSVPLASGQHRITETRNWYSSLGGRAYYSYTLAPRIQETGAAVPGDSTAPLCVSTSYATGKDAAGNLKPWMIEYANQTVTTATPCGLQIPNYSAWVGSPNSTTGPVLAASSMVYDNSTTGAVITGNVTETDVLGGQAGTAGTWQTASTAGYDTYGRVLWSTDPAGTKFITAYTPATAALPTDITDTGPDPVTGSSSWVVKKHLDPTRGLPLTTTDINGRVTAVTYDALGRTTAVWQPGRATGTAYPPTIPANSKFSYTVNGYSSSGIPPSVVETDILREDQTYAVSISLIDSLGRARQTQTVPTSDDAGRLVTDTTYDSAGRISTVSGPVYDAKAAPSGTPWVPPADQTQIPRQAVTLYDGLGRVTDQLAVANAAELWRTHTDYPGADRTDVTPPAGGVRASTVTDARGKTSALYTYHAGAAFGATDPAHADAVTYTYDALGRAAEIDQVADASGHVNKWTSGYDLLGHKTSATDPDAGSSTYTYDIVGNLQTSTAAVGTPAQKSLTFTYDKIGRKTAEYAGTTASGTPLATWSFDSVKALTSAQQQANPGSDTLGNLGRAAGSVRYSASGAQYAESIGGYDAAGQPLSASITIPSGDGNGALGGRTYTSTNHYTALGQLSSTDLPTGGDLQADTVGYGYNVNGLLIGSSDLFADLITDSAYSPYGEVQRRVLGDYPSQVVQDTVYDPSTRRVTNTTVSQLAWNAPIDTTAYTYDPSGHITAAVDVQGKAASLNSTTGIVSANVATDAQCYHYDYAGRLDAAWSDTGAVNTAVTTLVNGKIQTVNAPLNGTAYGSITYLPGATGGSGTAVVATAATTGGIGSCADTAPTAGVTNPSWQIGGPEPYAQIFGYDGPTGNRLTETDYTNATTKSGSTLYSYNSPGATQPHVLNGVTHLDGAGNTTGNDTYQYDGAGNTTTRAVAGQATQTLSWDAENQLASDSDGSGAAATHVYDADGTQLIRRDKTTTTLYLGGTELHLNLATNQVTGMRYLGGGATIVETGGTQPRLSYEAGNLQGTASTTIDAAAGSAGAATADNALTARRAYTPFNTPRGTGQPALFGTFPDDHTFLGKTTDTSTGLVDMGARDYDPTLGRFVSVDPLLQAADPRLLSGYAYGGDDPVNRPDPSGLTPPTWTGRACNGGYHYDPTTKNCVVSGAAGQAEHDRIVAAAAAAAWASTPVGTPLTKTQLHFLSIGVNPYKGTATYTNAEALAFIQANPDIGFQLYCNQKYFDDDAAMAACNGAKSVSLLGVAKDALKELSGWNDFAGCFSTQGSWADCGFAALDVLPIAGRLAKVGKLAELGADSKFAKFADVMAKLSPAQIAILCTLAGNSFTADTKVLMADGTVKAIQDVRIGDTVEATDQATGATGPHKVTALIRHNGPHRMVDVELSDGSVLHATDHHPFWDVSTGRMTDAVDLKPGDMLRTPDGGDMRVEATSVRDQDLTAFNITVDGVHTYYVVAGHTPVLVHNASAEEACGPPLIVLGVDSGWDFLDLVDKYKKAIPGSVSFKDYKDATDFFNTFRDALKSGSKTKIIFDLGNVDGGSQGAKEWADSISAADRAKNPGDNFTGWELALIQDAPADVRANVEWLNGTDPFAG